MQNEKCKLQIGRLFSFCILHFALCILHDSELCADDAPPVAAAEFSPADIDFFEKKVRPVLVRRCFECHSTKAEKLRGGLLLDSRAAALNGGDTGPAVVPGDVAKSPLVEAIGYQSEALQMPPAGKLPATEIADLTEWVRRGAPFPVATVEVAARRVIDIDAGRKHWAFQPLRKAELPMTISDWPLRRIDALVRAAQVEHGLRPSPAAERRTLIRRVKFDLVGLPPSPDEVDDFVADVAPDALERLVDRWLAAPQHGERWGRMWLDLARYCDVPEQWREGPAKAWLYRDWVVRAVNTDLPYDDFVRRQLAADLLPGTEPADAAALGFLGLSPTYWKELKLDHLVIKQVVAEEWEEWIEAIGGTFLGLTVACARCHDHKFDPITTHDYYALAGVLASIKLDERPIIAADLATVAKQARDKAKAAQQEIDKLSKLQPVTDEAKQQIEQFKSQIEQLRRDTPHYETPVAFGVVEASQHVLPDGAHRTKVEYRTGESQDVAVHIRGNPSKTGPVVPRRFLSVLSAAPQRTFTQGSGRRELAEAIVTDAAPLAARVFVNRIWKQHFGRGLVTTPSNFGTQGDRPSHPALLDDLAARFVENGWSTKWLHRELVLSATYQQCATIADFGLRIADSQTNPQSPIRNPQSKIRNPQSPDPDNLWLARMPVRRLDVESWRDALHAVSGQLETSLGGPSVELLDAQNRRRTLYGTVKRRELADVLRLHDFPDPVSHSASREPTTTPLQQLFVLNSPFLQQQSAAFVRRLLAEAGSDPAAQVRHAYRLLFGRDATTEQIELAVEFISQSPPDAQAAAWEQLAQVWLASNEFLFVD